MNQIEQIKTISKETVLATARKYGMQLCESTEYMEYVSAKKSADESNKLKEVVAELRQTRTNVQQAYHHNEDVSELLKIFQEKQQQYENLFEIKQLQRAQQQLINLFQTIAGEISKNTGINFVEANTKQQSCCG